MYGDAFPAQGAASLAAGLAGSALTSLSLAANGIGDDVERLAAGLAAGPMLRSLNLEDNVRGGETVASARRLQMR